MNNMMFYSSFKKNFFDFYKSAEYDRMLFISSECQKKVYGDNLFKYKEKMMIINDFFRNEKNNFSKMIGMIDILMPTDSFATILEKHKIDTKEFIDMFTKYLLMSKMNKSSNDEKEINKIVKKLKAFYGVDNDNLCILKIYEIQVLRELEKEKSLS